MPSDYRLEVRNDYPILLKLAYKDPGGVPIDLDGKAAFFYYSKAGKPATGSIDKGVIEFNIPSGKSRGPLADSYRVDLKDLRSEQIETILSGPLVVGNE